LSNENQQKEIKMNATIEKEYQVDSGIKEQILEQIPTPVMAENTDFEIIAINRFAGGQLHFSLEG
jgi:hypothetical protein